MTNKKKYTAPSAEIIILAAREPVTTTWKLPEKWWFTNNNHWGVDTLNEASVIGGQYSWFENIADDPEINDM